MLLQSCQGLGVLVATGACVQLKPMHRVLVRGYGGSEIEGVVISLHGQIVGVTTPEERERTKKALREPVVVGFPVHDVRPITELIGKSSGCFKFRLGNF